MAIPSVQNHLEAEYVITEVDIRVQVRGRSVAGT
jgi:hypothetical protein